MSEPAVVFISGTRKGIGKYLAHHYSKKGMRVEGCSRKEPDWSLKNYTHHIADVSDENDVRRIFASIQKRHGKLDIVINNAGIASMNHILLTPVATIDKLFATNLKGAILVCRESAKIMKRNKFGRIINFSTVAVPMKLDGEAIYVATKSAVEIFTRVIAIELAPFGITCNLIGPTPVETDLIRSVPKGKIDAIIQRQAIKRLGTFEDIAHVIDFFIHPKSQFITGQTLYLGGIN
jgi:3-oxoacyl-[acyl-carrier protein] reductase